MTKEKSCALALAACLLMLGACGKKDKDDEAGGEKEAATPVQVAKAEKGSIDRVVEADAVLFPITQSGVMPKISAPVKQFFVNRGDHVKAGQLLASLENRDLVAAEQESKANLAQAQAAYRTTSQATVHEDQTKAQADVTSNKQALDAAQKVYDSREELFKQGAIARKLVDDAKVALVQAQSAYETASRHLQSLQSVSRREQIAAAQAQMDAADARLNNARAQVSYTELRSPISGIVADRPVYPGEIVAAGSPALTIVDISQVVARANIPVAEAAHLRVGMPATVRFGEEDFPGKVTVVSPAVDANTTTVQIWVQMQNPGERLKPGASVHVSIKTETIKNTIVVPSVALLNSDEGGQKLMVVDAKSVAHEHAVEVGVREGEKAQILKGVEEGQQVVTVGGLGLDDKAKVKIGSGKEEDDEKKGGDKKDDDKKDDEGKGK
jgi:multidrug efflux pump subunit AcrA (membrane-fusion protein)